MAGFSMATGWIVLLSSVLTSKNQRTKESILLRTLGASKKQILAINAVEYFFLGLKATFLFGAIFSGTRTAYLMIFAGFFLFFLFRGLNKKTFLTLNRHL